MASTERALSTLSRVWDARGSDLECMLSVKGDRAGLEISAPRAGVKAVVYSPGDRWVALDLPDGFSAAYFEEGISDSDLELWLDRYVQAGIAYLAGEYVVEHSRLLRIPKVVIETSTGIVKPYLNLKTFVRTVMTRERAG